MQNAVLNTQRRCVLVWTRLYAAVQPGLKTQMPNRMRSSSSLQSPPVEPSLNEYCSPENQTWWYSAFSST